MESRRSFLAAGWGLLWPWNWHRRRVSVGGAHFLIRRGPSADRRYFWVHGNEVTARSVLLARQRAGKLLLVDRDTRYLPLLGGRLDPNRMFSRIGAERSLRSLNPGWTAEQVNEALDRLDRERPVLLKELLPPPGGLLVAMHNNSSGYSMLDEIPISDAVSRRDPAHPHEFLLCTTWSDFTRLERSPYNTVLQWQAPPADDGSLSRLCATRGIRYVNIEAGLAAGAAQSAMLQWVEDNLP